MHAALLAIRSEAPSGDLHALTVSQNQPICSIYVQCIGPMMLPQVIDGCLSPSSSYMH